MPIKAIEKFLRKQLLIPFIELLFKREAVSRDFFSSFAPEKIIVAKIHHKIGDLLVETPVLTNLKHAYPSAKIDFIAGEYNFPAVYNNEHIENVYTFKKSLRLSRIIQNGCLWWKLRKEHYDLGVVLSATAFSFSNSLLVSLVKPGIVIGLQSQKQTYSVSHILYNYEVPWPEGMTHRTEISLRTIEPMVPEPKFKDESVHFSTEEVAEARRLIGENSSKKLVGIHAGGTYLHKMWPFENYADLIQMLTKDDTIQLVVFTGKPDEEEMVQKVMGGSTSRPITIGPFRNPSFRTFRTMIACIGILDVFIGNDTGTLHAAAATGVRTIGIYTATKPERWKPLNENVHTLYRPEVAEVKQLIYSLLAEKEKDTVGAAGKVLG